MQRNIDRALAIRVAAVMLGFTLIYLLNAWVTEDAHITFRSIEQLFAGRGPRWNPHERVQAFTHPLWFVCLALTRVVSRDLFLNAIVLSGCLSLSLVWLLFDAAKRQWIPWAFGVCVLVSSKAYMDYSSSGLENSLSALLLVGLAREIVTPALEPDAGCSLWRRQEFRVAAWCALIGLCRHDLLLVCAPVMLVVAWRHRARRWSVVSAMAVGMVPLIAWTVFAIVYYGAPFPNTAYAKLFTGISDGALWAQGLRYWANLARWDGVTLLVLAAGIVVAARRDGLLFALAVGQLVYAFYITRVGGDFMAGRFFSPMFVLSVFVLLREVKFSARLGRVGAIVLVTWNVFMPGVPIKARSTTRQMYDCDSPANDGIADEKGFWFPWLSLWNHTDPGPDPIEGPVFVESNIGADIYAQRLELIVVDPNALADPLLARLPAKADWRIGHFERELPDGYIESLTTGTNQITNPIIRELYDQVRLVTSGPLFSAKRWRAIVDLNLRPRKFECMEPPCRALHIRPWTAADGPRPSTSPPGGHIELRAEGAVVRATGWLELGDDDRAQGIRVWSRRPVVPSPRVQARYCPSGTSTAGRKYCGFLFSLTYPTAEEASKAVPELCVLFGSQRQFLRRFTTTAAACDAPPPSVTDAP